MSPVLLGITLIAVALVGFSAQARANRLALKEQAYAAVCGLGDEAYGASILRALNDKPAISAMYDVLDELTAEGRLIRTVDHTYRPERGGYPRVCYRAAELPNAKEVTLG